MNFALLLELIVKYALLFDAGFVVCFALYCCWRYRGDPRFIHIAALGVAASVMMLLLVCAVWSGKWSALSPQGLASLVTFLLIDFGLFNLKKRRERGH